jgi:hypothetical protein
MGSIFTAKLSIPLTSTSAGWMALAQQLLIRDAEQQASTTRGQPLESTAFIG